MGPIWDRERLLHPPALGARDRIWRPLRSKGRAFGTNAQRAIPMPRHPRNYNARGTLPFIIAPRLGRLFRQREKRPSFATITVSTNVDPACVEGV
jgi:hypothetical protein